MRLPLRKSFRRIDAEDIRTGLHQCRNAILIIPRIDARPDDVALLLVQQFAGILFMGVIILAKHKG
ncbi:hypothetical protein SDC9_154268 [bioreactor metagenome]|uniref:Uncharacterized protein n=1 Tax=bioreactor metagenome TaxID=1076179 RepID=A0A645F0Q2_9ZZZZ